MKVIRKGIALLAVLVLFASGSGCGSSRLSAPEKELNVKVIVKKRDFDYWAVVKMGAEAAGKEFGVNVDFGGPTDEKDVEGQYRMVSEAIDSHPDAIVLAANDYTRLVSVAEEAVSRKIPVIMIDSGINSKKIRNFIGTDNVDAGEKLGETLADKVGKTCKVAVMSFIKGAASAVQREEGLFKAIGKYPGIQVLTTEYYKSNEDLAQQLTEKIVKENPGIDAIVCLNAYGTVGTARAIDKMKLGGKVKVVGFDSTPEEIGFMENGVIQGLVIQNPFNIGYLGIKYALDAINGKPVPEQVNTGSKVIDKDNMYLPENQKLVFPFTD